MAEEKLEKTNIHGINNNFEIIIGFICTCIALVVVYRNFMGLTEDAYASNMLMFINMMVGMFLLNTGVRRYRFMKKYNRYVDFLNNAPDLNLHALAEHEKVSSNSIAEDFGSIIRMKILPGAYVDKQTGYLVLSKAHDYKFLKTAPSQATAKLPTKEKTCDECGAMNEVEDGFVTQCKSCGHLIVDE